MIAAGLEKISGGAKTFRYGGEEFAAVFPGKTASEAWPYLEEYRQRVASTAFIVRSKGRLKSNSKQRGTLKTEGRKTVQVTVSIGISSPDKQYNNPEKVLKAADKILYMAKKAGRNRVLT
jgi:diguanylate cyclase (GGDEF)-like protein